MAEKIAFFVQHMLCGGVENALISVTERLSREGKWVTIFVITESGEFMRRVPDGVAIYPIPMPEEVRSRIPVGGTKLALRNNLAEGRYLAAAHNLYSRFFGKTEFAELNVNFDAIPELEEPFDVAVNFHMHSPFLVRYLSEKVKAEKKYTWIHNDFTTTGYQIGKLKQYLACNDGFFGVARRLVKEFSNVFPEYRDKTDVALNIVPAEQILQKGMAGVPEEYAQSPQGALKLLSVGRLEDQKGYDLTVGVCRRLLEDGFSFRWFILGEGSRRSDLEKLAKKAGVQETLHFLGIRMNPYPYFKDCDIYVQTSRHEGYVTTVTEAKIFARPIVCTDVSGAREQLEDGINGDIAEIEEESIYKLLRRLMEEPERRACYSEKLGSSECREQYPYLRIFE